MIKIFITTALALTLLTACSFRARAANEPANDPQSCELTSAGLHEMSVKHHATLVPLTQVQQTAMEAAYNRATPKNYEHFDSILTTKVGGKIMFFLIKDDCVQDEGRLSISQFENIIGANNGI